MSEVSGGVIVVSVWLVVICWDRTWNKAYLLLQRTLDVGRWQLLLQTHISYPFTHSSFPQGVGRFVHQRSKYIEWESWQKDRQVPWRIAFTLFASHCLWCPRTRSATELFTIPPDGRSEKMRTVRFDDFPVRPNWVRQVSLWYSSIRGVLSLQSESWYSRRGCLQIMPVHAV